MRGLLWTSRIVLFLLLFAFAIKNTDPVGVHVFLDATWHAPLIIVVLASFAGGAGLAVLFLLGTLLGQRRELARLQRELNEARTSVASDPLHRV